MAKNIILMNILLDLTKLSFQGNKLNIMFFLFLWQISLILLMGGIPKFFHG